MVDFNTAQGDCVATYLSERSTIENLIARMPGRICLTLDLWNSNNTTGYVFITGQFIDSEWNIHKRLLSVVMELEIGIESLISLLSEKNPRILNGQLVLTNCLARALTSAAQEALQVCQEMVKKVIDCVKYVKASEALEEYFPDLKQLQVLNTRNLFTRILSGFFKSPSGEDWNLVDNLCTYLKLIFDTASMMASSNVPTANTFFYEAWKIQLELTCASTSEDNIISTITKPMQEGFDKYWKSNCFVLAIAVVMDPRFKMKLVDFCFAKIFGVEDAHVDRICFALINIVDEGIHQLFLDYAAGDVTGYLSHGDGHGLGHTYFEDFTMESASQQSKSELDQYLEESSFA
ncbi:zinc finger BED domain-containing protein DAYSLEEPER-like protein [Tanacetum coccineum]